MCGIAGCYQQADGRKLADVMTDRIAHRGPDAGGVWSHEDERVSMHLGHRRLSIIDLSTAADQPLRKGSLALIYNGELYNYKELRQELQAAGATFVTSSDTEVVLEGWRHWGPAALDRFRGMFAFALADTATGELVLARDPLGIKPLFYTERGDGIVFASELKAIVAALGTELRIEPGDARRLHALLLGPRAALRHPGRAQAPGRLLGPDPPGRPSPRSGSTGGFRTRPRRPQASRPRT